MEQTNSLNGWTHGMWLYDIEIAGEEVAEAQVLLEDGLVYLAQNEVRGNAPRELMGWAHAWCIGTGSEYDCDANEVSYNARLGARTVNE